MSYQFSNDMRLAYINGRLKSLENQMLTKSDFEQMVALSGPSLEKALEDHLYSLDIDTSIRNDKMENFNFVLQLIKPYSSYRELIKFLYLKNDFLNIKNYLKNKILTIQKASPDYSLNFYSAYFLSEEIKEIIDSKRYALLSEKNKKMIGQVMKKLEKDFSSLSIEHIIDNLYLELFFDILRELNNSYFLFFFQEYIDLINLENLLRIKFLNKKFEEFTKIFFSMGKLKRYDFKLIFSAKMEEISDLLKAKKYYHAVKMGIEKFSEEGNFSTFQLQTENYLLQIIRMAKVSCFGIEPIFSFFMGKETEYLNLRILINGKKNNLSTEKINQMLRETYV